jgi:hypothetical protein
MFKSSLLDSFHPRIRFGAVSSPTLSLLAPPGRFAPIRDFIPELLPGAPPPPFPMSVPFSHRSPQFRVQALACHYILEADLRPQKEHRARPKVTFEKARPTEVLEKAIRGMPLRRLPR